MAFWLGQLRREERLTAYGLALVIGGAIGNLIDRIWLGKVVDFLQWHWQEWYWPSFNLADSAITVGVALLLTFPVWITVNYLGNPDNGVIVAGYIGSWLMAGGFLAIGACMSALTRNQVVAFILSVVVCFGFLLSGLPMVMDVFSGWAPQSLLDAIADFSFLAHFSTISRGVIDLRDLVYFALVIGFWLLANTIVLEMRKAD